MDIKRITAVLLLSACTAAQSDNVAADSPANDLVGSWTWVHNDTLCRQDYVFRRDGTASMRVGELHTENRFRVSRVHGPDDRQQLALEPAKNLGGFPCNQQAAARIRGLSTSYLIRSESGELLLLCPSPTRDDCEGPFHRTDNNEASQQFQQPIAERDWTLEQLETASNAGNPRAQTVLGLSYQYGNKGLTRDGEKAALWLRKAATQGYGLAAQSLGQMLENGIGVPLSVENKIEARHWYEIASAQGLATAQMGLAFMMQRGQGGPKDEAGAVSLYRKAADQGQAGAQSELGLLYETGRGVPQDMAAAIVWYRRSAYQGDAFGLIQLAHAYASGHGVPASQREAAVLTLMAAVQGVPESMREMGSRYLDGAGVAKDTDKARLWLTAAAKAGDSKARGLLDSLP